MDPHILAFSQVMAIIVPSVAVLTGVGVLAHWVVERTNRMSHRPPERVDDARMERLEHAIDAIAMELERLGENQRYVTKLLAARSPDAPELEAPPAREHISPR